MRLDRTISVVLLFLAATRLGAQDVAGTPGVRGAILGEHGDGHTAGPKTTVNTPSTNPKDFPAQWLESQGAHRIEDLNDALLFAAMRLGDDQPEWAQPLSKLARDEATKRGLFDETLPMPSWMSASAAAHATAPEPQPAPKPKPKPAAKPASPELTGDLAPKHKPMQLTPAETEVLARIVKGEAWPTSSFESHVAIAAVVLNRVRSGRFGASVPAVAHAKWQFSCYNADVRGRLYDGPIPDVAMRAAEAAAAGSDPTDGATFYFNPYIVKPDWAAKLHFIKRIGTSARDTHDFYR